mmetsp:Transcript_35608/g.83399  ORF Transcript_35608/g.83399 Transcript_35608/m.83399 type:complete len:194 (-) Transcript_35608:19-600(-)
MSGVSIPFASDRMPSRFICCLNRVAALVPLPYCILVLIVSKGCPTNTPTHPPAHPAAKSTSSRLSSNADATLTGWCSSADGTLMTAGEASRRVEVLVCAEEMAAVRDAGRFPPPNSSDCLHAMVVADIVSGNLVVRSSAGRRASHPPCVVFAISSISRIAAQTLEKGSKRGRKPPPDRKYGSGAPFTQPQVSF